MKAIFICQSCGYTASKWLGRCPECNQWDTFIEENVDINKKKLNTKINLNDTQYSELNDTIEEERFSSGLREVDGVIGGGFVRGSLILLGGEPGVGKSTLLLQIASSIASFLKVLYISGEEGVSQISLRAKRLKIDKNISVLSETNFDIIEKVIEDKKPDFLIVDSIQTIFTPDISSAPGSVSQVREVTMKLMRISKKRGITIVIVGHVTKDGSIAGPRVLEHMVDCVLYFEGERFSSFRIIRAYKNRFGPTNEIGVFEMIDEGLKEITNPSLLFYEGNTNMEGTSIYIGIEGTRPLVLEIQALTVDTPLATPRRTVTGVDYNRCMMLCAVLEKKIGLPLRFKDIFVNVVGGFKVEETAADLAIIAAIASSYKGMPIGNVVLIGEVGLCGELRAVSFIQKRI